jgi:hypothetical protein
MTTDFVRTPVGPVDPYLTYVPELREQGYWRVQFDSVCLLMDDAEFYDFVDTIRYDGVEYQADHVRRTPEYFDSLPEAAI